MLSAIANSLIDKRPRLTTSSFFLVSGCQPLGKLTTTDNDFLFGRQPETLNMSILAIADNTDDTFSHYIIFSEIPQG